MIKHVFKKNYYIKRNIHKEEFLIDLYRVQSFGVFLHFFPLSADKDYLGKSSFMPRVSKNEEVSTIGLRGLTLELLAHLACSADSTVPSSLHDIHIEL